jgi:hypothetical protein
MHVTPILDLDDFIIKLKNSKPDYIKIVPALQKLHDNKNCITLS